MNPLDPSGSDPCDLGRLLASAGLRSYASDDGARLVHFVDGMREWSIAVRVQNEWLNVLTFVCALPAECGARLRVLEAALRANRTCTQAKFGIDGTTLVLELDARAGGLTRDGLLDAVDVVLAAADDAYPRIARAASGDDVLAALETATRRGHV